ncbi:hypothetical protein BB560_003515, partial [Smittium megazygosporum]
MAPHKSKFRPCIDLHSGVVKQIVGGTLTESNETLLENYVSSKDPSFYAELYKKHNLTGGHIIKLGPGNEEAAKSALFAWPGGMQIGGGITLENAQSWIDLGASKVIVTSSLFKNKKFDLEKLVLFEKAIGKDRLVVDLSCRRVSDGWVVAMDKWQTKTDLMINRESISLISQYCSELLIHAADVEGLCKGIDTDLVKFLGEITPIPTTYAGGIEDLAIVNTLSNGKIDLTIG